MKTKFPIDHTASNSPHVAGQDARPDTKKDFNRRSFLRNSLAAGAAATAGAMMLDNIPAALAEESHGHLTRGDAAILRWLAAAEIIESDIWLQYQELAGTQDNE